MREIDRTPKPCAHPRANHQHGTYACYVLDLCRCLQCCFASSEYDRQRKRRNAYGRSNLVDAGPARVRVAELMAAGVGLKQIVRISGVPQGVLWKLMYGKKRPDGTMTPSRRITRTNADRLLALRPGDRKLLAGGARMDSTGTRRRLQALACIGWSIHRFSAEASIDRQPLDQAMRGDLITARIARAVAAAYEQLWNRPPTPAHRRDQAGITRTINNARSAGWAPPLAWDDDTIDDPAARPSLGIYAARKAGASVDDIAVQRAMHGDRVHLTRAERSQAVQSLTAAGMSAAQIAERLNTTPRSVQRHRARRTA